MLKKYQLFLAIAPSLLLGADISQNTPNLATEQKKWAIQNLVTQDGKTPAGPCYYFSPGPFGPVCTTPLEAENTVSNTTLEGFEKTLPPQSNNLNDDNPVYILLLRGALSAVITGNPLAQKYQCLSVSTREGSGSNQQIKDQIIFEDRAFKNNHLKIFDDVMDNGLTAAQIYDVLHASNPNAKFSFAFNQIKMGHAAFKTDHFSNKKFRQINNPCARFLRRLIEVRLKKTGLFEEACDLDKPEALSAQQQIAFKDIKEQAEKEIENIAIYGTILPADFQEMCGDPSPWIIYHLCCNVPLGKAPSFSFIRSFAQNLSAPALKKEDSKEGKMIEIIGLPSIPESALHSVQASEVLTDTPYGAGIRNSYAACTPDSNNVLQVVSTKRREVPFAEKIGIIVAPADACKNFDFSELQKKYAGLYAIDTETMPAETHIQSCTPLTLPAPSPVACPLPTNLSLKKVLFGDIMLPELQQ